MRLEKAPSPNCRPLQIGKSTRELLTKTLQLSNPAEVELFSTNYDLSGRLQRWGAFKLDQLNLCHGQKAPTLRLAQHQVPLECQLSLEQLIDLASQQANDNYLSLYLNFSSNNQFLLHQLPVLIETLSPENQRLQQEEWQLVKRFQLISAQPKFNRQHGMLPRYEDAHKLQLYRSLRYLSQVELQYTVHPGQRIGLPLLRLNYRNIEIADNASLKQLHPFQLSISFVDSRQRHKTQLLLKLALPLLLLWAFAAALFRLQNLRRRRAAELCNNLVELLLQLSGNVAKALLMTALMLLTVQAYNYNQLAWLSYSAFLLQLMFLGVHLRRISQLNVFLIDWERPRSSSSYEGQGQRMNLDSSSLCSSVRTYVAESSVSAWRILFTANAWIRLSASQSYSTLLQAFAIIALQQLCTHLSPVALDLTLQTALISGSYLVIYAIQILVHRLLLPNPLQKFVDLCSQANVSLFSLLDPSYGYYIHGRSPHGFADTDMSSMILQLQREGQNMCGRRGLLMDSDKQAYIILPPRNLHIYLERLLLPLQRSRHGSLSQTLLYQKDIPSIDGQVERTSIAYASVNRFFCAFIDHAIKDMDYIIKEKSLVEKLCNCEIDNYLTENKGTFYIDDYYTFSHALLLGNHFNIFVLELLILLSIFMLTSSLLIATALICVMNKLLRYVFIKWVRCNVSRKTLIDERFLL
ncbi:CG15923 [Drosophila busckii]|uniref:CG15923 n=1 Tax=Drosophila busckii TaxID=30019 RepID=A0A0M5J190_DROBS|nr:CG15923 [Drosophila busckii]